MRNMVRTFCLLWMMLALPLQGMAQASMFACHSNGAGMGHGTEALADHAAMDHGMNHDTHTADPDSGLTQPPLAESAHGCCTCATSCTTVVLPSSAIHFGAIQSVTIQAVPTAQVQHSVEIRRIDRPPKTSAI